MVDHSETVFPAVPSGLGSWFSDEAKVFYLNLRARGVGLDQAYERSREAFGSGEWSPKRPGSLVKWESREAKEYLVAVRSELKSDYSKLRFSQKWERVAVVGEVVLTLLVHFELEDRKGVGASHVALTKLSSEIRQGLAEIHEQLEGAGLDDARIVAVAEEIERRRAELASKSDRGGELLGRVAN